MVATKMRSLYCQVMISPNNIEDIPVTCSCILHHIDLLLPFIYFCRSDLQITFQERVVAIITVDILDFSVEVSSN